MATFNAQINDLVGAFTDTAAITQFLRDGIRQLVNVLPSDRLNDNSFFEKLDNDKNKYHNLMDLIFKLINELNI